MICVVEAIASRLEAIAIRFEAIPFWIYVCPNIGICFCFFIMSHALRCSGASPGACWVLLF